MIRRPRHIFAPGPRQIEELFPGLFIKNVRAACAAPALKAPLKPEAVRTAPVLETHQLSDLTTSVLVPCPESSLASDAT